MDSIHSGLISKNNKMVNQNLRELVLVTCSSSCLLPPLPTHKHCMCRQYQPHLLPEWSFFITRFREII